MAFLFARAGITKRRYRRFVSREGHCIVGGMNAVLVYKPPSEPECQCEERVAWLNRWGAALANRLWS